MSIIDYHDFVMQLKNQGYTHEQIRDRLEKVHGYTITRQAVSKYINKQGILKLTVIDQILKEDLEVVFSSRSTRKAHEYLLQNGYKISYHKVHTLRNKNKS